MMKAWAMQLVLMAVLTMPAVAQTVEPVQPAAAPTVAATGSESVTIGGAAEQRAGDTTSAGGVVVEGSSNVFINGRPAGVAGGSGDCGNGVVVGSASVFINGKPAAVAGGAAAPCPQ